MPPSVLVLTTRLDFASDYVTAELAERNVPFLRLNSEDLPSLELGWRPSEPSLIVRGEHVAETVVGPELRAALVRRPTYLRSPPGTATEALAAHHWLTFLHGLQSFTGLRWMNHPASDFVAENKMVQLSVAADVGFHIPNTTVTNSTGIALRHLRHATNFAIKGLDTVLWREGANQFFCYTEMLDRGELEDLDLSGLPTIVQERLRPKTDVRVTVVGDQLWAATITDRHAPIDVDWRTLKQSAMYTEHELPDSVRSQCFAMMRRLGLSFAAIDLVRYRDGYVFLELNPVGEWGWLAESLGWDVAVQLAKWLGSDP